MNPIFVSFISFYEIIEEKLLKNSHFQGLVLLRFPSSSLQSFLDENRSSMESQSAKEEERGGFFSRAADTIHYDLTVARKRI